MQAILWAALLVGADEKAPGATMTVYNDGFAVIREPVPLNLKAGVNEVRFTGVTAFVEPESVLLRDPTGKTQLRIQEQSYRADAASKLRLLELNEGKTIEFEEHTPQGTRRVKGRIVRAGGERNEQPANRVYPYPVPPSDPFEKAIIEVDGKLQFGLPGNPLFPSLGDDSILRPTLFWKLAAEQPVQTTAQLSYITQHVSWHADYNAVVTEKDDGPAELSGVVTVANTSGKNFPSVSVKLVAGSVRKVQQQPQPRIMRGALSADFAGAAPEVTERAFDEYHIYTLPRPIALREEETKQVEFLRSTVKLARKVFALDAQRSQPQPMTDPGQPPTYKVGVYRVFANSAANGLGMPLPKGRIRFHRRDDDGQLEFLGEGEIDHTPTDRPVRVMTGHAFDLFATRRRTNFRGNPQRIESETIEIVVGNRKKEAAQVHVYERFPERAEWRIEEKSHDFTAIDSATVDFTVDVPASGETKVTYTASYRW